MNSELNSWDLLGIPRWKCHKIVNAAQILGIEMVHYGTVMKSKTHTAGQKCRETIAYYEAGVESTFEDKLRHARRKYLAITEHAEIAAEIIVRHEPPVRIKVTREWMKRHNPQIGGYFVAYDDGYHSYSPQQAFEQGYRPNKLPPFVRLYELGHVIEIEEGYRTSILGKPVAADGNRRGRAVNLIMTIPREFAAQHGVPAKGRQIKWMREFGYVGILDKATNASYNPPQATIGMELLEVIACIEAVGGTSFALVFKQPTDTSLTISAGTMRQLNIKAGEKVGIRDGQVVAVQRNSFLILVDEEPTINPLHFGRIMVLGFKEITSVIHHDDGVWEITMKGVVGPLLLSKDQIPSTMIIEVGDEVRIENNQYVGIAKKSSLNFPIFTK